MAVLSGKMGIRGKTSTGDSILGPLLGSSWVKSVDRAHADIEQIETTLVD